MACARLGVPYVKAGTEAPKPILIRKANEGTFEWLATEYKRRIGDKINPGLYGRRSRMFEEICESKLGKMRRGDLPYKEMLRRHVVEIRDELRETPGARNHVIKTVSSLFSWAIEVGLAEVNPASKIKALEVDKATHTWTIDEIRQYEDFHGAGTRARLMLHLAMYTGLRLADLAIVGRQHVKNGWLSIRPGKTRKSSGVLVELPVLSALQKTIDESPTGNMTFLITEFNKPFTVNGLGNKMRDWCDQASLFHCSTHGLRKAGASIAAENGATDEELMAIYGWVTKAQTTTYTKNANRRRIATNAVEKLMPEQRSTEIVPRDDGLPDGGAKSA
ncbi:tyrosine-type recombinase/integrase [Agrobacterium rosae]|uniref:tyrosine-type recombinase/integrase n=1 Tax=Agrobacterium rosae TaxID=1972867 RepID=UPI003BA32F19